MYSRNAAYEEVCRYSVVPKTKKSLEDIDKFIKENHFDECGIIYCLSRMDCEKVAERMKVGHLYFEVLSCHVHTTNIVFK